jgi:hypothetical protein
VLPAVSRIAWTESYPSRPVRFVVGFAPGGGGDLATRLTAQWLSERLRQQFVVENRVGASSNLATEQVVLSWVAHRSPVRRPTSPNSSRPKRRSGPRWLSSRALRTFHNIPFGELARTA